MREKGTGGEKREKEYKRGEKRIGELEREKGEEER